MYICKNNITAESRRKYPIRTNIKRLKQINVFYADKEIALYKFYFITPFRFHIAPKEF